MEAKHSSSMTNKGKCIYSTFGKLDSEKVSACQIFSVSKYAAKDMI